MKPNFTLYVKCYKNRMWHGPNFIQNTTTRMQNFMPNVEFDFTQIPLMCESIFLTKDYRNQLLLKNFKFDDEGDNISDLNWAFAELTGTYYIWKNTNHEFVGHVHYRRYWEESQFPLRLEENVLYHNPPLPCIAGLADGRFKALGMKGSIYDDWMLSCGKIDGTTFTPDELVLAFKRVTDRTNKQLLYNSFTELCTYNPFNLFFGHKTVYDKFCEVLFEILFDLYNEAETYLKERALIVPADQRRMIAFMSEVVITGLIHNHSYFFGNTKFQSLPIRMG